MRAEKLLVPVAVVILGCCSASRRQPVRLDNAELSDTNLSGKQWAHAHLANAELVRASLRGADLRGAQLGHACLMGANLQQADLRNADLSGCDLLHADFRGARLDGVNLKLARYDQTTRWPPGFIPESRGAWRSRRFARIRTFLPTPASAVFARRVPVGDRPAECPASARAEDR